jgi:hypothetical protein
VFILESYYTSKSFTVVCDAFSNAYHDKELSNKTSIHLLVTEFRDTGSACHRDHVQRLTVLTSVRLLTYL